MATVFNMNQFSQSKAVGQLDLHVGRNPSVFSMRIDPDSSATTADLVPGAGVVLTDGGANDPGGIPIVDERSTATSDIFGVILYNSKINEYEPGDAVEVAASGSVVTMEASAAIVRGASVALVLAAPGEVVTRTTETILGVALDKATADGDLIRVRIA